MSNTAGKTRTATMDCSHQVTNDYNTSRTRSAIPAFANPNPALVLRRMLTDDGLKLTRTQTASVIEQALMDCLNGKSRTKNYNPSITPPISSQLTAEEVLA